MHTYNPEILNLDIITKMKQNEIVRIYQKKKEKTASLLLVVLQSLSCVQLFVIPWTAACQASLSFTWSLLRFMYTESGMLSNHLTLCCPLLLLPSIFPSIRVFSNEPALRIRWPKYWNLSFSISPSNEYSGLTFTSD